MRRISFFNNEALARSFVVRMPGYDMPPLGEWTMELRRRAIATGAPDFVFSSAIGNLRVLAFDAPNKKVVLALLAPAQAVAELHDSYIADLVYVEGERMPTTFGPFAFMVGRGVTHVDLNNPPPAYDDLASWPPIVDISGASAATMLSMVERGLPGPPGGVTDHGVLTGLNDDDHPQYFNLTRGDARYLIAQAHLSDNDDHPQYLNLLRGDARYAGIGHDHAYSDHGGLTGLSGDDHPQYLNLSRGDARYAPVAHQHAMADVAGLANALDGMTHHGALAERAAFVDAGAGFLFLQTDDADGRLIAYIKLSNANGDWSPPIICSPARCSVAVWQLKCALKTAGHFDTVTNAIEVDPGERLYEAWSAGGDLPTKVGDALYLKIVDAIGAPAAAAAYSAAAPITL